MSFVLNSFNSKGIAGSPIKVLSVKKIGYIAPV